MDTKQHIELDIQRVKVLRGPNIWARFPVLEAWIDLGDLKEVSSDAVPGFNDRLKSWLPTLIEHRCSIGERGGFFQRLERGTYPAHVLEHITIELQCLAGTPVGFGKARETSKEGVYRVVVRYENEDLAKECLYTARKLLLAAFKDEAFDIDAEVSRLRELAYDLLLGPSTRSIVEAAKRRGIPAKRLNAYSLVQLGIGSRQKRIQAAETENTSAIAEGIAQDKELTRKLLSVVGVPTPYGWVVSSLAEACSGADEIGFPVVIKPYDGNQGKGVATNLTSLDEVRAAYEAASQYSSSIIVEKHIAGDDYRVLVVGDRVSAAARREPAQVIGDGVRTVADLVEEVNKDPRRGNNHATSLSKIVIDDIGRSVLESQGLTKDSIPKLGQKVLIRRNANLSTGGTAVDVTDTVHPEVAARAVEAARIVGLDIAGVDVVTTDITKPLEDVGGVIVEVNAAPGLRMHLEPSVGTPRNVGNDIVSLLFSDGEDGRIPLVAVSGVNGKTTTVRTVAHILRTAGHTVGMTTTDGVYVNERRIESGDCSGPKSAGKILMHPMVTAASFEVARGGVLREGLAFDRCNAAIVTNIGEGDHLGINEINTVEDLAAVKQCIVEVVDEHGTAVLNAEDLLVTRMAQACRGKVLFFALNENSDVIQGQLASGGRAAFVRNGILILAEGKEEHKLIEAEKIPLTCGGKIDFHTLNALSASAACWSIGIPMDAIRRALTTLSNDVNLTRGRFSVMTMKGATVVVDYGHNVDALKSVIASIEKFPAKERIAVYSVAGDRRDEDFTEQGKLLGMAFDTIYAYEDTNCIRGRKEGDIIRRIEEAASMPGSRTKKIIPVMGAIDACKRAVSALRPGDLLLMQLDLIDETIAWLNTLSVT